MLQGSLLRGIIGIMVLPDKAYTSFSAIMKSIYRMIKTKKNLLEWTTSEEAEKMAKKDILSYYKNMPANIVIGLIAIIIALFNMKNGVGIFSFILGILWEITPFVMWNSGKEIGNKNKYDLLDSSSKEYVLDIAKRTWLFFKENINESTNYLPPDNYQESRKEILAMRTSSTNIGLRFTCCSFCV